MSKPRDRAIDLSKEVAYNVPRFIHHIKARGGVQPEEWAWLYGLGARDGRIAEVLDRADEYLLYPKNEETFKEGLFILVKAIALLAFAPGGIRIFGYHFCDEFKDYAQKD